MVTFMHNGCMIDSRLLTLRTFASCGTVSTTAELTGYSPSAVSAQLRELQRSLDMQLLVKDGRGLRLTAAGRYLVKRSDTLIAEWESIKAAALRAGDQTPTHFGMGGFSTAASNLLAPLAAHVKRERPGVQVHVLEASPARCLDLLVAERIDLAVVVASQAEVDVDGDPRFEQISLLNDPLDVIVPADHAVAGNGPVTLEELSGEEWITDVPGTPYHDLFTAAFSALGLTPRVSHEAAEWDTSTALVEAGLGIGLVPRLASLEGARNVVRVRIAGQRRPTRKIVAAVRSGSAGSPLITESLAYLRATAQEILASRLDDES
ncbi:LysR family transcriptional regulator [Leucobacter tardus]